MREADADVGDVDADDSVDERAVSRGVAAADTAVDDAVERAVAGVTSPECTVVGVTASLRAVSRAVLGVVMSSVCVCASSTRGVASIESRRGVVVASGLSTKESSVPVWMMRMSITRMQHACNIP